MEKVIGKIPYAVEKVSGQIYIYVYGKKIFAETS